MWLPLDRILELPALARIARTHAHLPAPSPSCAFLLLITHAHAACMRTVALFVPMQAGRVHAWPPNLHERNELNDGGAAGGLEEKDKQTDTQTDRQTG